MSEISSFVSADILSPFETSIRSRHPLAPADAAQSLGLRFAGSADVVPAKLLRVSLAAMGAGLVRCRLVAGFTPG